MSPLRKWMTAHGRPEWYSWVVVVVVPLLASMGVLVVSLRVNQQAIERERSARVAAERQVEASRLALCEIYVILDDAYQRTAPTTEAGRDIAEAVARARVVNRCPPRR